MASLTLMIIHPARKAQIALLLVEEIIVPDEYSVYADVLSKESVDVLLEYMGISEYAIQVEKDKQLSYRPIYNLGLVELKIIKTYIKINLPNSFIRTSKSLVGASIFFVRK